MTSIQRLLGHRRLNSTMIYARVHDRTAADDYYRAMAVVEKELALAPDLAYPNATIPEPDRVHLLHLVNCLAESHLDADERMQLMREMRWVLAGTNSSQVGASTGANVGYNGS